MKIIYKKGSFLDGDERFKMHGCNAQGVMGSGAALEVKMKFPSAMKSIERCTLEQV